jgi:hypothetical protein
MSWRNVLLVAVLGLAALSGCSHDQCPEAGQTKCQGSQIVVCSPYDSETAAGTYLQWDPGRAAPCPDYCVEAEGQASCSPVPTPVPQCARDGDGCWQGAAVVCLGGFPVEVDQQCRVDAGETCTVTRDPPCSYCRPADVPVTDPGCACLEDTNWPADSGICFPGTFTTCSNNVVTQCACGLRLADPVSCGQCALNGSCSSVADGG